MLNPAAAASSNFLSSLTSAAAAASAAQAASASSKSKSSGSTPSISITPLPRTQQQQQQQPAPNMKPGQSPNSSGQKNQFVICEICDGYIKDLDQLRNHMQWIHKVKVKSSSRRVEDNWFANYFLLLLIADPSQNDLQSSAVELPKMSISILHRSGSRATFARLAWSRHLIDAGSGEQWKRLRPLSCLREGE